VIRNPINTGIHIVIILRTNDIGIIPCNVREGINNIKVASLVPRPAIDIGSIETRVVTGNTLNTCQNDKFNENASVTRNA